MIQFTNQKILFSECVIKITILDNNVRLNSTNSKSLCLETLKTIVNINVMGELYDNSVLFRKSLSIGLFVLVLTIVYSCGQKYSIKVKNPATEKVLNLKPNLNIFIENSGSMNGYVLNQSDFRDDLYAYVDRLSKISNETNLYYINSQIIPIHDNIENFFANLNATSFKAAGGNHTQSDIVDMMKFMLNRSSSNTVTLFASDCILDLKGDTKVFLNLKKTTLSSIISDYKAKHPGFGFRILCLESNYDGFLFPSDKSVVKVSGKRPYYIWIFGPNNLIGKLTKEVPDKIFGNHYLHSIAYSDISSVPNMVGKTKGNISNNGVVEIKSSNPKFDVYANFSRTLQDDKILKDKNSYDLSPFLEIESIDKINYRESLYSHIIHLKLRHASKASVSKISLKKNSVPNWVDKLNDESGDRPKTTCGIKSLITGIKEAFDNVYPVTIDIEISKK